MITGILTEGLIYSIMVLGLFISFRVLNFADLTVDGSFPMGAAIMAVLLTNGIHPLAALLLAFFGGACAGLVTGLIHTRLKVPDLLSGILTMTMLYSVNLRIMSNRANVSLLRVPTLFTHFTEKFSFLEREIAIVLLCLLFVIIIKILIDVFFHTDYGLSLGALGANPQLIISQGMNPDVLKISGLCLSNGLVAAAGAFAAMYQGFADAALGSGMIVSGLASLMMGEFLIRSNRIGLQTLRVIFGSILYRGLMYLARNYGYKINMTSNDLQLITGILIILCIFISKKGWFNNVYRKKDFASKKIFKRGGKLS